MNIVSFVAIFGLVVRRVGKGSVVVCGKKQNLKDGNYSHLLQVQINDRNDRK